MTGLLGGRYLWWMVSRASGIVALVLISLSVLLGLAMAARMVTGPRKRSVLKLHEHLTVASLVAIAGHGLALLGDTWLRPGVTGLTVPFTLGYRPVWTGLGVIAGYLAVLLGPSYYLRRRIGTRLWRKLHRGIVVVWLLGVVHALGAGSDAGTPWLRATVLLPAIPIVYALTLRVLGGDRRARAVSDPRPRRPPARSAPASPAPHRS